MCFYYCLIIITARCFCSNRIKTMKQLRETYSEHFDEVFETITTDNGSEFADLSKIEKMAGMLAYYIHP